MTGDVGADVEIVELAVRAAVRAPSPHNTQPWEFHAGPDGIEVFLDESRLLRVADPGGREAALACGAALFNMRIALAAAGYVATVDVLPDRTRPRLVGVVRIGGAHRPTPDETRLAGAVPRRHTNRRPFLDRPVPGHLRHALTAAAEQEGARLVLLSTSELDRFAELLRHADHLQSEDPGFRAELGEWTHPGGRSDGVPASAGGPRPPSSALLALRDYGVLPTPTEREFERDPLVGVLASAGDTRRHWLLAGLALERVLLTATAAGLSASFLAQPIEVDSARRELTALLAGRGHPQTALRVGYGYPGAATPRRPVAEVTHPGGHGG